MRIEKLRVDNLREGIFCAAGRPEADEWYGQLEAWLDGDVLHGRFARADDGTVTGFVLYLDLERAPFEIEGVGYYMMQCLFVKPAFRGQGVGKVLIEAALDEAQACGASGLVCEAFRAGPQGTHEYLPGGFFQHRGMPSSESRGLATLYYTVFRPGAPVPRYVPMEFQPPRDQKIRIDILDCRRCWHNITNRNVVDSVLSRIDKQEIVVHWHDQSTRQAVVDKGMSSGVFVDGKLTFFQGPVSEEDILHALEVAITARKNSAG